jgi:hypothetical protein
VNQLFKIWNDGVSPPIFDSNLRLMAGLSKVKLTPGKDSLIVEAENTTDMNQWEKEWKLRRKCCTDISWAIPTDEAIKEIVQHSPLVEIGAGTGFWASLILEAGGDVLPFDIAPPDIKENNYHNPTKTYTKVYPGDQKVLIKQEIKGRTLFLCWPPLDDGFLDICLQLYTGNTIVYVGEWDGCTAWSERMDKEWTLVKSVNIPQWFGIHDRLMIFQKDDINNG